MKPRELRLQDLLGREVLAGNNRPVGRIEEFRAARRAHGCEIVAFVIGAGALAERLHVGARLLLGGGRGGHVARWDQIDLSNPEKPRLTCAVEELEPI